MAKIIQVTPEIVTIGFDDGSMTEVRRCDLTFVPQMWEEVEVYRNETKTIVSRVIKNQFQNSPNGININVNNSVVPQYPQYSYPNKKVVSKTVYCLLAFFIGGLGIHRFYAGKIGSGILFVCFCWTGIPVFISFIDLISGLCKKSDSHGNILV